MVTMGRGLLNAAMMCGELFFSSAFTGLRRALSSFHALPCPCAVYPMQTGKQRATLIARHRAPLLALAAALTDCCNALGDVFVQNTDIG